MFLTLRQITVSKNWSKFLTRKSFKFWRDFVHPSLILFYISHSEEKTVLCRTSFRKNV